MRSLEEMLSDRLQMVLDVERLNPAVDIILPLVLNDGPNEVVAPGNVSARWLGVLVMAEKHQSVREYSMGTQRATPGIGLSRPFVALGVGKALKLGCPFREGLSLFADELCCARFVQVAVDAEASLVVGSFVAVLAVIPE